MTWRSSSMCENTCIQHLGLPGTDRPFCCNMLGTVTLVVYLGTNCFHPISRNISIQSLNRFLHGTPRACVIRAIPKSKKVSRNPS